MSQHRIIPIKNALTDAPVVSNDDKHVQLAEAFFQDRPASRKQKNLTPVELDTGSTKRSRVALIVAPEWTTFAPPYGIARMAALSQHSGFATRTWDLNILTHSQGPQEYWTAYADWKWTEPHYSEVLHPLLEPILLPYLEEIVAYAPDLVGFSVWYTNETCSSWIAQYLKQHLPNVKIVFGGPQATQGKLNQSGVADYIVRGEGELWWVRILEELENPTGTLPKELVQPKANRIDLDSMPPADYRDFNFDLYQNRAISSEFSRGCIANCQYCSETTFWKFRARQSTSVLEEIEIAYRNYGVDQVWFIDSLLNGNLRELKLFAEGLLERNINVRWTGYSRVDGKMDIEFWRLVNRAGGWGFAFGVESGSQKVLDLMKKNCDVWEIENNFRDLAAIGCYNNFATWFVGFPGEEITDVAQTFTLFWRLRNSGMGNQSIGTCGLNHDTPIHQERERFNISLQDWSNGWYTNDMRNTIFHRFIRFKTANILLEVFRQRSTHRKYEVHVHYPDLKNQYQLSINAEQWVDEIPFEYSFDYNIIKLNRGEFADSLVNEIWPLLRVLWLGTGAFKLHLEFNPDTDRREFGYFRYPDNDQYFINAKYDFEIDAAGNWAADFDIRVVAEQLQEQTLNFGTQWKGKGNWTRPLTSNN